MRSIKSLAMCAFLIIICLLVINYINQSLKEGYRGKSVNSQYCAKPEWLFNNYNNFPPRYQYKYVH
jgi:hypothetical protein